MKGLKCTTNNCEYNSICHCTAGIVNINEKGVCSSKMKRSGGVLSQSFSDMEASSSESSLENMDTLVQCDAECVYNDNFKCTRENLLIEDSLIKTKCFSRKKN